MGFWDYIFPPRCPVCDKIVDIDTVENDRYIHEKCEKKLIYVKEPTCLHCGAPVEKESTELCSDCARKKGHTSFRQGKSLYVYKGDIKRTMYRFKYYNKREYARFFAKDAVACYGQWIRQNKIQAITAIPMYKAKQRKRGYNQAEVLAREISRGFSIPLRTDLVLRKKSTKAQKELSRKERKKNMERAFVVKKEAGMYRDILLVDDIYTTGSTANAIAGKLKAVGVKNVYVLTLCIGKGI